MERRTEPTSHVTEGRLIAFMVVMSLLIIVAIAANL